MNDDRQVSFLSEAADSLADKPHSADLYKVCIDGASRNNPGKSGVGIVIYKNDTLLEKHGYYVGIRTNNQAEYASLLIGLFLVKKYLSPHDRLVIVSDSQLLVRQLLGVYQIKHPELKPLYLLARHLLAGISYKVMHVLREHNVVADEMANQGIDEKKPLPYEFKELLAAHHINW